MGKICTKCNNFSLNDEALYCYNCGKKFPVLPPEIQLPHIDPSSHVEFFSFEYDKIPGLDDDLDFTTLPEICQKTKKFIKNNTDYSIKKQYSFDDDEIPELETPAIYKIRTQKKW